jgi:hypothetical protein
MHRADAEGPQDFEPAIGEIGQRVSECRILPIEDRNEPAIPPLDIPRPIISVEQGWCSVLNQRPRRFQCVANPPLRE